MFETVDFILRTVGSHRGSTWRTGAWRLLEDLAVSQEKGVDPTQFPPYVVTWLKPLDLDFLICQLGINTGFF